MTQSIKIPAKYVIDSYLEPLADKLDASILLEFPSFKEFIDLLTSIRGYYTAEQALGEYLKTQDLEEQFCHVELSTGTSIFTKKPLCRIWHINDWQVEYKRYLLVKKQSEKERQEGFRRKDAIERLIKAMAIKMPVGEAIIRPMAELIINTRNKQAAAMWGIEIEDWSIGEVELEQIMKEQEGK